MKIFYTTVFFLIFFLIAQVNASAQNEENGKHHHFFITFGANSGLNEGGETNPFGGINYEYKFYHTNPELGIGLFAEAVFRDETESVFGLPLFIHPYKGFKFFFAPSMISSNVKSVDEPDDSQDEPLGDSNLNNNTVDSDNEFFIRVGVSYDFYLNNFFISPSIVLDQIGAHSFAVYGVNFGIKI